ncbi:DUF302 domain-containing protein [Salmonella enterica]|nr:DUF302 domain-containing protein [Salmonella enterica subsp. arizonae]EHN2306316.1 DUF302 domain-containing protein [Salmonella enterica]
MSEYWCGREAPDSGSACQPPRLNSFITPANGLVLFGEFDHAKAAHNVGLTMPPTTVLVFGNPKGGTPLMLAHPDLALDLPFRVLISQLPDGQVDVSYHATEELLRYGLDAASVQTLKKLEQLVQKNIQP